MNLPSAFKNKLVFLGSGSSGMVYKIKDEPDKVLKIQTHKPPYLTHESLVKEIDIQKHLASKGLAPKVFGDVFQSPNGKLSGVKMENLDGSVKELMKKGMFTKKHSEQIDRLVKGAHKEGVMHFDVHRDNIMFKKLPDGELKFFLIDFGKSVKLNVPIGESVNTRKIAQSKSYFYQKHKYNNFDILKKYENAKSKLPNNVKGKAKVNNGSGPSTSTKTKVNNAPKPATQMESNLMNIKSGKKPSKPCKTVKADQICNPLTGKAVKKDGKIGKTVVKVLGEAGPSTSTNTKGKGKAKANNGPAPTPSIKTPVFNETLIKEDQYYDIFMGKAKGKPCKTVKADQICNPLTGKSVSASGPLGKIIQGAKNAANQTKAQAAFNNKIKASKMKALLAKKKAVPGSCNITVPTNLPLPSNVNNNIDRNIFAPALAAGEYKKTGKDDLYTISAFISKYVLPQIQDIPFRGYYSAIRPYGLTTAKNAIDYVNKYAPKMEFIRRSNAYIKEKLSPDDVRMINHYTQHGDGTINFFIREGRLSEVTFKRLKQFHSTGSTYLTSSADLYAKKFVGIAPSEKIVPTDFNDPQQNRYALGILIYTLNRLSKILNEAPKARQDMFVFRGNKTRDWNTSKEAFRRFGGFGSTSLSPFVANGFVSVVGVKKNERFVQRIKIQKGTPLLFVGKISKYPHELEVLLPTNTIYYRHKLCDSYYTEVDQMLPLPTKMDVQLATAIWSKKSVSKMYPFIKNQMTEVKL